MTTETMQDQPIDLADVKIRVAMAGWREGADCEHCGGTGRVEGGRLIVHSQLGMMGADWDADDVIAAVERAESVRWVDGFNNHHLEVVVDGRTYLFQVKRPTPEPVSAPCERAS